MRLNIIRDLLRHEAAGGVALVLAAIAALIVANSPWSQTYQALLDLHLSVGIEGVAELNKSLLHWINDGLMAVFFLLVGLEIKREILEGELSTRAKAMLPGIAALGGMIAPALTYCAFNFAHPQFLAGWAIPAATDIAFAVGVLAVLGKRVPMSLKIFLLALAVMDDLGAIVIIAVFYTADLSITALLLAFCALAALAAMNVMGIRRLSLYIIVGIVLWVFVLKSGVHATLAGVALGLAIPNRGKGQDDSYSPMKKLEHGLMGWVSFFILPVFAFANAGVSLGDIGVEMALHPVTLGIGGGLVIGKQVGVVLASTLAIWLGWGQMPSGASWRQLYGVAVVTGIGFTMSLFIGGLAFPSGEYDAPIRLGVLGGSLVSAALGMAALLWAAPAQNSAKR